MFSVCRSLLPFCPLETDPCPHFHSSWTTGKVITKTISLLRNYFLGGKKKKSFLSPKIWKYQQWWDLKGSLLCIQSMLSVICNNYFVPESGSVCFSSKNGISTDQAMVQMITNLHIFPASSFNRDSFFQRQPEGCSELFRLKISKTWKRKNGEMVRRAKLLLHLLRTCSCKIFLQA